MYAKDPELAERWARILRGLSDQPAAEIRDSFGCRWAVVNGMQTRALMKQLLEDPVVKIVFEDRGPEEKQWLVVLEISPPALSGIGDLSQNQSIDLERTG